MADNTNVYKVQIFKGKGAGGEVWQDLVDVPDPDLAEQLRTKYQTPDREVRVVPPPEPSDE